MNLDVFIIYNEESGVLFVFWKKCFGMVGF